MTIMRVVMMIKIKQDDNVQGNKNEGGHNDGNKMRVVMMTEMRMVMMKGS